MFECNDETSLNRSVTVIAYLLFIILSENLEAYLQCLFDSLDHLAIGAGDGCLRVWNLNETSKVDMTTIVIYTRVKIMTVSMFNCKHANSIDDYTFFFTFFHK